LAGGRRGKRYSPPNPEILLHQVMGGAEGQAIEVEIAARHIIKIKTRINQLLAKHAGQPLKKIEKNNFHLVFYPCQSGNELTIILSNIQLAKSQFYSYSHPYPTGNTKLTHVLVSPLCETDYSLKFYNQKPIFISGICTIPYMIDKTKNKCDPHSPIKKIALIPI